MLHSRKFSFLNRVISLFVSCSLIFSQSLGYAAPSLRASAPKTIQDISLPEKLGKIEESFQGSSGKTIVYIQDAHDSLEAQENIAKTIHYLVEHYGAKTVYEEGYEGPVPTDEYFGFMKDPVVKEKVSYFLMDKLRIGGAEYAHINRKRDFKLIGADNIKLHLENIKKYRDTAELSQETKQDLQAVQTEISRLASQRFSKELKEWMKIKEKFSANQLDLLNYLKRIKDLSAKYIPAQEFQTRYPNVNLILLPRHSERSEESPKKDPTAAPQDDMRLTIDSKILFQEIERLENDFANTQLNQEQDKKIFQYYKGLQLLGRLDEIQLKPAEFEAVKENLQKLKTDDLAKFVANITNKPVVLFKRWERNIQNAIQFYELAEARDQSLGKNFEEFLRNKNEKLAVLVFGGFHKDGIKQILRSKEISYQILMPRISSVDSKHQDYYKQSMMMRSFPFEIPMNLAKATRPVLVFDQDPQFVRAELRTLSSIIASNRNLDLPLLDRVVNEQLKPSGKSRSEVRAGFALIRTSVPTSREGIAPEIVSLMDALWDRDPQAALEAVRKLGEAGPQAKAALFDLMGYYQMAFFSHYSSDSNLEYVRFRSASDHNFYKENYENIRKELANTFRKIGRDAFRVLIAQFIDDSFFIRTETPKIFGLIGADAVPALIEAVEDPQKILGVDLGGDIIRAFAADALGEIGPDAKSAASVLLNALKNPVAIVRKESARALAKIEADPATAIPPIAKLLNDTNEPLWLRHDLAKALSLFGLAAVPALIDVLNNNDYSTRQYATQALSDIGPAAIPALMKVLNDANANYHVIRHAAFAIGHIGGAEAQKAIPVLEELQKQPPFNQDVAFDSSLESLRKGRSEVRLHTGSSDDDLDGDKEEEPKRPLKLFKSILYSIPFWIPLHFGVIILTHSIAFDEKIVSMLRLGATAGGFVLGIFINKVISNRREKSQGDQPPRSEVRTKYKSTVQLVLNKKEISQAIGYLNEAIELSVSEPEVKGGRNALQKKVQAWVKKVDPESRTKFGKLYTALVQQILILKDNNYSLHPDTIIQYEDPMTAINSLLGNYMITAAETKPFEGIYGWRPQFDFESTPRSEVRADRLKIPNPFHETVQLSPELASAKIIEATPEGETVRVTAFISENSVVFNDAPAFDFTKKGGYVPGLWSGKDDFYILMEDGELVAVPLSRMTNQSDRDYFVGIQRQLPKKETSDFESTPRSEVRRIDQTRQTFTGERVVVDFNRIKDSADRIREIIYTAENMRGTGQVILYNADFTDPLWQNPVILGLKSNKKLAAEAGGFNEVGKRLKSFDGSVILVTGKTSASAASNFRSELRKSGVRGEQIFLLADEEEKGGTVGAGLKGIQYYRLNKQLPDYMARDKEWGMLHITDRSELRSWRNLYAENVAVELVGHAA